MATDTNIEKLIINKLTQAQYDGITTKSPTEIYVVTDASDSSLPDQTGNAGKFLTTDGTNASWGKVQAAAITTDATLTGSGTADSPLGIAATVPAQTGTFVLKCIDGTLTWVAEITEA